MAQTTGRHGGGSPIETKPSFLTSELVVAAVAVAGIAITAASSDAFGAWRAWILITAVVVGYLLSRGIAKAGSRSRASDPREHLRFGRDGAGDNGGRQQRQEPQQPRSEQPTQVREREEEESKPLFG